VSYQITVVVKDGKATVDDSGTSLPPDGKFTINGHVPSEGTWQAENIAVARMDSDDQGRDQVIVQAASTHHRVHLPKL
jgi:hypothetical protein